MSWPLRCSWTLALGFFAMGCSEKAEGPPTEPNHHEVLSRSSSCDVSHIDQLANSFFSPPRKQTVKGLVDLLANQDPYSLDAKNSGFDIMAQMEGAVHDSPATSGDPIVGSDLVNHLLLCMYNPTTEAASYPASFPDTFIVALSPSLTGAFGHRSTGPTPVYARSAAFDQGFSAVAPVGSWGVVPPDLNNPSRVVFYGRPATTTKPNGTTTFDEQTYDWRTIPHDASFNPDIVIAVCVDAMTAGNTTLMLNEQGVAVLAFEDAGFLNPANCSPTTTALLESDRPFQFARRLARFGTELFAPSLLQAAVLLPGGVGGRSSKCCSKVGAKDVASVSLTVSAVDPTIRLTDRFSLTATTKSGLDLVNGSKVTLSTTTNKGVPTSIRVAAPEVPCSSGVPPEGITGSGSNTAGTYRFTNLCFTSTGNVFIVATANVQGRDDTPVTATSNKINVKP